MAKTPHERDAEAAAAKRDLNRLQEQSEKLLGAQHDAPGEEEDFAEVWGKRIGRGLGFAFAVFLIIHLYNTYFK